MVEEASVTLAGKWTCVVGYRGKEGRASAALSVKGDSTGSELSPDTGSDAQHFAELEIDYRVFDILQESSNRPETT